MARQLCTQFHCTFSKAASFDENLAFLREMLAMVRRAFKAVVFVLDEMEQYTRRSKQLVLYNLLDALTSSSVRVSREAAVWVWLHVCVAAGVVVCAAC